MLALAPQIEQHLIQIAQESHVEPQNLLEQAVLEFLEDYEDARTAEKVFEKLERSETELVSFARAKRMLREMVH